MLDTPYTPTSFAAFLDDGLVQTSTNRSSRREQGTQHTSTSLRNPSEMFENTTYKLNQIHGAPSLQGGGIILEKRGGAQISGAIFLKTSEGAQIVGTFFFRKVGVRR